MSVLGPMAFGFDTRLEIQYRNRTQDKQRSSILILLTNGFQFFNSHDRGSHLVCIWPETFKNDTLFGWNWAKRHYFLDKKAKFQKVFEFGLFFEIWHQPVRFVRICLPFRSMAPRAERPPQNQRPPQDVILKYLFYPAGHRNTGGKHAIWNIE